MGDNMNDDKKTDDQLDEFEEEFDFEAEPGEEDALAPEEFEIEEDEEAEPVAKQPRKSMLLPIVIAAAVVGFVGWKVIGMFTGPKEPIEAPPVQPAPKMEQPAPIPTPPVEKAAPQSTLPSMMEAPNVIPQDVTATEDSLKKLQKKLEDQDTAIKQRISNLERDLGTANQNAAQANAGINKLQNDLAALNATVMELTNQLKAIHDEREKQQVKAAAKKAQASQKAGSANPSLSVYAIIPGRAWLRSGNGKTTTVTEGDTIGEYGKVLKIDAGNGVVVTSSGVTLR